MAYVGNKSEHVQIQGTTKWSQINSLDPEYGSWHITLYPNPDSLNKIRDLQAEGLKNVIKKDDDNQYYVKFSRQPWKEYTDKNGRKNKIEFAPPTVTNRDGSPFRDIVGTGSSVTLDLEVYQHGVPGSTRKAKAARLSGVMIDELVPFSRKDYDEHTEKVVQKMEETPYVRPEW